MIHSGGVAGTVPCAVERGHAGEQVECRDRRRRQEVAFGAVDQQHGTVDLLQRVFIRFRPVALDAGVEHADSLHARIRAERDRKKSAARLSHRGDVLEVDFAFQRRAVASVFLLRPRDRFAQIVGVLLSGRGARLRHATDHQEAVRRDRREEARVARAVDGAAAVAPRHHRQLVPAGESAEILRTKDHVARRAEGGLRHDFVWARDRFRRAFERQRRPDQVGPGPGRLRERNTRSEDECSSEC